MQDQTKVLFIGDIIGKPGRIAVRELLPKLVGRYSPDIVIANGENAAGGFGITPEIAEELKKLQVDVITSGNHIWDKKEVYEYLGVEKRLLRPANYPQGSPGAGSGLYECPSGFKVGVVNLMGRIFMDCLDSPFIVGMELVRKLRETTPVVIVDFHAETTSEKMALGWHLDGVASAVIGTHTHVQTSDERVLTNGTAFITDAGMTGPIDSVIGMRKEVILERFLTHLPARFDVATKSVELQGVFVEVDNRSGKALRVERIKEPLGREV
ncbi:MAG: TIGR00282 family metallophosphoesterase [Deltaproteobacteria bacterium]|nr:TIGR00282 family metallophosphoesterase [Deltaproteobacteria bacterium]